MSRFGGHIDLAAGGIEEDGVFDELVDCVRQARRISLYIQFVLAQKSQFQASLGGQRLQLTHHSSQCETEVPPVSILGYRNSEAKQLIHQLGEPLGAVESMLHALGGHRVVPFGGQLLHDVEVSRNDGEGSP